MPFPVGPTQLFEAQSQLFPQDCPVALKVFAVTQVLELPGTFEQQRVELFPTHCVFAVQGQPRGLPVVALHPTGAD